MVTSWQREQALFVAKRQGAPSYTASMREEVSWGATRCSAFREAIKLGQLRPWLTSPSGTTRRAEGRETGGPCALVSSLVSGLCRVIIPRSVLDGLRDHSAEMHSIRPALGLVHPSEESCGRVVSYNQWRLPCSRNISASTCWRDLQHMRSLRQVLKARTFVLFNPAIRKFEPAPADACEDSSS